MPRPIWQPTVAGGQVVLTWTAPGSGTPVVGYDILRDGTKIGEATGTTYTDDLPVSLATHTYVVESVSAAGVRSGPSNEVVVSIGDTVAPDAPTGVAATAAGPNSATVTWTAATDNVGVAEYRILRANTQVGVVDAATTSWTDTSLLSQTSYSYTVTAADAAGNVSAASGAASVTTPDRPRRWPLPTPTRTRRHPPRHTRPPPRCASTVTPCAGPYIMVPVGSGTGSVARARLRVYLQSKLTAGFSVYAVAPTWTEKTLTWNSAPQPSGTPVSSGPVPAAGWVEIDVTSLIPPGSPTLSVALISTSGTSVSVSSRETTNKPNLLVDWSG